MTATSSWLQEVIKNYEFTKLDFTNECVNIKPKEVITIENDDVEALLLTASPENKIVYMLPSAKEAYSLEAQLLKKGCKVVAITSKKIGDEGEEFKSRVDKAEEIYEFIVKNSKIPDDINIILTTTKLREGVNIKDPNVKIGISGCHTSVDIIQFAGRVRNGLEQFYIVLNKKQNYNPIKGLEVDASMKLIPKFNEVIRQYFNALGIAFTTVKESKAFIDLIEKDHKFGLIRFDNYTNEFILYSQKIWATLMQEEDIELFNKNRWNYIHSLFGNEVRIVLDMSKKNKDEQRKKIAKIIADNLDKELDKYQQQTILNQLTEIGVTNDKGKKYKYLGAALSKLGYGLIDEGDKTLGRKTIQRKA